MVGNAKDDEPRRILIVEDYQALADIEVRLCSMEGYETRVATTVADALAAYAEWHPHLVMLDIGLAGGASGDEFLDGLPATDHETRILIVSGQLDPDRAAALRARPHVDTLSKPFLPLDLATALHRMLADG